MKRTLEWYNNIDDDVKELSPEKKKKYENNFGSNVNLKYHNNHIYVYGKIDNKSCLELNIKLKELEDKLIKKYDEFKEHQEYIYIHINSNGGSVFAAFSTVDTIKNIKIPVVSIIEGCAASAATLISVVCDYRIIYKTSFMLIHELSSSTWGKFSEMEEEMSNNKLLMNKIKDIYKEHTNINNEELDEILKHDLWWNSDKCLNMGLVQEIKSNENIYTFNKNLLKL